MWAQPQLKSEDLKYFVRDARDYALLHGSVLRYPSNPSDNWVGHIPLTLFPSPFPSRLYQECLDIQPTINELMLKIANDEAYIEESLKSIVKVDDFTRNLIQVQRRVHKEGLVQPIISCINRSDYMLDSFDNNQLRIRQVEMNAIASSMSAHSHNISNLHRYLMSKYRLEVAGLGQLAANNSFEMVCQGIIDAFDAYGKADSFVLLVADDRSFNFSEQHSIEIKVHEMRQDIRLIRRRFVDLPDITHLGPNRELIVDGKEIALVYFRYCYDPSNYSFSSAWDLRFMLERSLAIKCPSINFHLSGAKKFQQILCDQTKLERFLTTKESERLSNLFCKFWSIEAGNSEGEEGYQIGLKSSNLVCKPQREGGGHNIFGQDVSGFLRGLSKPEDRSQYILMERINSPREKNWLLLHQDSQDGDKTKLETCDQLISELGIYGSIIADRKNILKNDSAGFLVRSKRYGTDEGGVASGYAGISSLLLVHSDNLNSDFYC